MRRRDFLAYSAIGGAGALLSAPPALARLGSLLEDNLSVGFLSGSERYRAFTPLPWQWGQRPRKLEEQLRVDPAESLLLGDQELALGFVEVQVRGFYPAFPRPRQVPGLRQVTLTVLFASDDPLFPDPVPFTALGSEIGSRQNQGSPSRFIVPLPVDGGLELLVECLYDLGTPQAPQPVTWAARTRFTVDWEPGRPRLQRGLYLLGLGPDLWRSSRSLPGRDDEKRFDLCSLAIACRPARDPDLPG